jgi:hypothetical protein
MLNSLAAAPSAGAPKQAYLNHADKAMAFAKIISGFGDLESHSNQIGGNQ